MEKIMLLSTAFKSDNLAHSNMATILLPFNTDPQLTGAMVGDSVYYIDSTDLTGASGESGGTNSNANNVIHMGTISGFSGSWNILVDTASLSFTMPTSSDYVFFTKNNNHNMASVLGYYAQVKFTNDSSGSSTSFSIVVDTAIPYLGVGAVDLGFTMPTSSDYVFFTKNNNHDMASLLGYYAQVQFENDSTTAAELFSVGMEVAESSK